MFYHEEDMLMKERSNVTIPSEIEATRLRFEEWRRRRTARERIPETLWSEAVAVEPADFRCGIDGLARVCRQKLKADPFCGALFVFRNRRSTSVKILAYDGIGFWLCQKRLSKGRFCRWPNSGDETLRLEAHQL